MKNLLLIIAILSYSCGYAHCDVAFVKDNVTHDIDGFKNARYNLKEGDKIFNEGNTNYMNLALPFYEKAFAFNPNNADLNYKLGVCYLFSPEKRKCLEYFQKSYAINPAYDTYNIEYLL